MPLAAALQSQVGTRGILDISLSPGMSLARVTGPGQPLERGPSVRCSLNRPVLCIIDMTASAALAECMPKRAFTMTNLLRAYALRRTN